MAKRIYPLKISQEEFVTRAKAIHGDRYDYSISVYRGGSRPVEIICLRHGVFSQTADTHFGGSGCRICAAEKVGNARRVGTDGFIKRAKAIHGEKYDYSKVKYVRSISNVRILCKKHGPFDQCPQSHLDGAGCPICNNNGAKVKVPYDLFLERARNKHGSLYVYKKEWYTSIKSPVRVICRDHGEFTQKAESHLLGKGCPKCNASSIEKRVINLFDEKGITYEFQKTFPGCKNKNHLKFDFFLPSINLIIEVNGAQHVIPVTKFGGEKALESLQRRDILKREFVKSQDGLRLLDISHENFKFIEDIITKHLSDNYDYVFAN